MTSSAQDNAGGSERPPIREISAVTTSNQYFTIVSQLFDSANTDSLTALEQIVQIFRKIAEEQGGVVSTETRLFEQRIGALIADTKSAAANAREWEGFKHELERLLLRPADDFGLASGAAFGADDIRFAALYGLCMAARLQNDLPAYERHLRLAQNWNWATRRGSFAHLEAMLLSSRQQDLDAALQRADAALHSNPDHAGFIHHSAEIIAMQRERNPTSRAEDVDVVQREAMRVQRIAGAEDYPKFWATLARLQTTLGQFDAAERLIAEALAHERDRWDSDFRRATYLAIRSNIQLGRDAQRFQAELRQTSERLATTAEAELKKQGEDANRRHAEILAFFTGGAGLLVGGIQAMIRGGPELPASQGAGALPGIIAMSAGLLMLAGVLLVVFGGLGWVLRGDSREVVLRSFTMVFLGGFAFAVALLVLSSLSPFAETARSAAAVMLLVSLLGAGLFAVLGWYGQRHARPPAKAA